MLIDKITSNLELKGYKVKAAPTLTGASGTSYTPALLAESETSAVVNFDNGHAQFSTIMLTHLMAIDLNVAAFVYADEFSQDEKNWALAFNVHLLGRVAIDPPAPLSPPAEPGFPSAFELLSGFDTELRIHPKPSPDMWLVGCEAGTPESGGNDPTTRVLEVGGRHESPWLNWLSEVEKGLALKREAETAALPATAAPPLAFSEAPTIAVEAQEIDRLLVDTGPTPPPEGPATAPAPGPAPNAPAPVANNAPENGAHARPHKPESAEMRAHRHGDLVMV
ncbi:MAG: hypothetical protein HY556_06675 [Euryarchaeota archaeon]|nr:hypothetical protein [Euryarchaeota archaeon]